MSLASPPSRAAEQRDELAPSYTRDEGFPPRSRSAASSAYHRPRARSLG